MIGLVNGTFGPGWEPVPASMPVSQMFAYFSDLVYIGCGVGLLLRPTAAFAGRVLFVCLLLWLLLLRLPWLAIDPQVGTWWPASSTSVILGAAWTIYASLATEWDRNRVGFIVGGTGIRIAQTLFGIGLIPLGIAHFISRSDRAARARLDALARILVVFHRCSIHRGGPRHNIWCSCAFGRRARRRADLPPYHPRLDAPHRRRDDDRFSME